MHCVFLQIYWIKNSKEMPYSSINQVGFVWQLFCLCGIHPNDCTENERWITGITKDLLFNSSTSNLHDHPLPKPGKIPAIVHDTVKQVVQCNPGITPSQLKLSLSTAYNMKVHLIFVYLYNYAHNLFTGIGTALCLWLCHQQFTKTE